MKESNERKEKNEGITERIEEGKEEGNSVRLECIFILYFLL